MGEMILYNDLPDYLRSAIASGGDRAKCPTCDGGSSREHSLSIRQDSTVSIKLSCFRSTCGWYAYTVRDGDVKFRTQKLKPPSVYREELHDIGRHMSTRLCQIYGLEHDVYIAHGWKQNYADTLVMPIRCPNGGVRGHVTRTFDKPKKCYTYKATAQPWLDHWPTDEGRPVVIVEDCLSACRLAGLGYYAIALLGTSMTVEQAKEIAVAGGAGTIYLALDRDAYKKALMFPRRFAHILTMLPVCLTEDIKNMDLDIDIFKLFTRG